MFQTLRELAPRQRRAVIAGFVTLLILMTGHLLVETARDAVFLANIPATELPILYLAIAAFSFATARFQAFIAETWSPHRALVVWLMTAAAASFGLWFSLDALGDAGIYLLYIWPAIVTTVALFQFWWLIGNAVTVDDAKRLYVFLGAGGGVGAMVGSGVAALLSSAFEPSLLLTFAAGAWALAPIGVIVLAAALPEDLDKKDFENTSSELGWESVVALIRNRYARNLALLSICLPGAGTIGDYLFKSLAADRIAADSLGPFFGSVYLVLNLISVIIQLTLVQRVVQRLSVAGAVAILPCVFFAGGLGVTFGFAFISAVGIKVADGSLRHSLHSTAQELLFVPLSSSLRSRMKSFESTIGKRGGQALASLGLLVLISFGIDPRWYGIGLLLVAGGAAAAAVALKQPYFELFRSRLRDDRIEHLFDFPDLDADSLEDLVSRLSSSDDAEVLAALELLEDEGRARAIPSLILYHPSGRVVTRALSMFVDAELREVVPVIERVETDAAPPLRAALVSARAALQPDKSWLEERLDSDHDLVRSTAAFHLVAHGWRERDDIDIDIDCIIQSDEPATKQALAFAIGAAESEAFLPELRSLLDDRDVRVRKQAVDAFRRIGGEEIPQTLLAQLSDRQLRDDVIDAYESLGGPALQFAIDSLENTSLPRSVRWQIPRVIGAFDEVTALEALAEQLPREHDGVVRARIVSELERARLLRDELPVPEPPLEKALESLIERAGQQLHYRDSLERLSTEKQQACESYQLLSDLLEDKHSNAIDLIFRLLAILYSSEDIRRARRGLESDNRIRRASGRELLEGVLPPGLRGQITNVLKSESSSGPPDSLSSSSDSDNAALAAIFDELLEIRSEGLALMVAQFVGRFRLAEARPCIEGARKWATGEIRDHLEWAIRRLDEDSSKLETEPSETSDHPLSS